MTQQATPPRLSIIIPHWNGRHHLEDCLGSLRRQTFTDFEVILADNGSTDGSQATIHEQFPEVRLLELGENRGFTGACLAGYAAARGEYICLLNNDTETAPDWAELVVAALDRRPDVGIVTGKILLFDERDRFHTAGDFYRIDGIPGNRGVFQADRGQYECEEEVFGACGAAATYRRTMLDAIGFLDDAFYFSCEDVDLSFRANLAGWRVLYVPTAVVYHKLKASGGGGTTASYYDGRNFLYVIWKDYPGSLLRRHWPMILRSQLRISIEALGAWRGAAARARLRGQLAGLFGLFRMLPARRATQALRRIDDATLTARMTAVDDLL